MLARYLGVLLTVALATVLTIPALAQGGATLPSGYSHFTEPLEVRPGETLTIGPGTSIWGTAFINVSGTLRVNATAASVAEFRIPIRVHPGGQAIVQHARFEGINATAIEVLGGDVELRNTAIGNSTWGIKVNRTGRLAAEDVILANQSGEALSVSEAASVFVSRATFADNGRGATVYSARAFHVNDSDFVRNAQHLVVDLGPWSVVGEDLLLARDRFHEPLSTPAQLAGIVLRHGAPLVDASDERIVRMDSNLVQGAAVGLHVEGRGLAVHSVNDTFVDNVIGLRVQQSTVRLERPTFGNDRDVEGSGRVALEDATYLRARGTAATPGEPAAPWAPWLVGGGLV
ncbi:MAG TPA: right-handed parallel beta-helix repeat-containing protein, partial [Candidatus Thermoplasmatota archaeon]|nr:right-handed parallel beta-helix repeat-containing protein [Candidatus Thermoplasmatota archaeon]